MARCKSQLDTAAVILAVLLAWPSLGWSQEQPAEADEVSSRSRVPFVDRPAATAAAASRTESPDERPPATPAEVAAWISELDSREYRVRELATRQLMTAGAAAFDPLLAAVNGDRPEPADRSLWILQKLAGSGDEATAMNALSRLIQLSDRPSIVAQAETELERITVLACKRRLEALGATCTVATEVVPSMGVGVYASVFHAQLGAAWRGTTEDLRPLAELRYQRYVRLEGAAIDDTVVKMFEPRTNLARLEFHSTKVSVAAVNSLKAKQPNVDIYLKNRALMGVACTDHPAGAYVQSVSQGTSAEAAGVLQGDVITAIDGERVPDFARLTARVAQHEPGDKITLEVLRGEEKRTLNVTLGSWEAYPGF